MEERYMSSTRWECCYCIIFTPRGDKTEYFKRVRMEIHEILKKLCAYKKIEIKEGAVGADYVRLCVNIPPKVSVAAFVGYLKGRSSVMIFEKHPLNIRTESNSLWSKGYYVTTVGEMKEEIIRKYISEQRIMPF